MQIPLSAWNRVAYHAPFHLCVKKTWSVIYRIHKEIRGHRRTWKGGWSSEDRRWTVNAKIRYKLMPNLMEVQLFLVSCGFVYLPIQALWPGSVGSDFGGILTLLSSLVSSGYMSISMRFTISQDYVDNNKTERFDFENHRQNSRRDKKMHILSGSITKMHILSTPSGSIGILWVAY